MIRFILALLIAAVLCLGALYLLTPYKPTYAVPSTAFVALITFVAFRYLFNQKDGQMFVQIYLATIAIKLFAFAGYCLAVLLIDRDNAPPNIVYFLIIYPLFTALEITFLFRRISDKS